MGAKDRWNHWESATVEEEQRPMARKSAARTPFGTTGFGSVDQIHRLRSFLAVRLRAVGGSAVAGREQEMLNEEAGQLRRIVTD